MVLLFSIVFTSLNDNLFYDDIFLLLKLVESKCRVIVQLIKFKL